MQFDNNLLIPAEGTLGKKCDIGGCENEGVFWVDEWRICGEHFNAYLDDDFDLEEYFRIKKQKIEEALAEAADENAFWERYFDDED